MSSIYIHIPYCKQACHYCDFHFSTSFKSAEKMVLSIVKEIEIRKDTFENKCIETIYFGGGTPSSLKISDIDTLLQAVFSNYNVVKNPEITLEANPDDLTENYIIGLSKTKINRLSIGVQSFFDDDLQLMNRAHNSQNALECLKIAKQYFDNISIDLIYGIPNMSNEKWLKNIEIALQNNIPHLSCYALTVENKTAYKKMIDTKKMDPPNEDVAYEHFKILIKVLKKKGFVHYEFSNFGKKKYFSQNNSNYWLGKEYLGFGPSAHSFDITSRSWNISNNNQYIKSIENNILPFENEILTLKNRYNEYVMTGLRTIWGVSIIKIENEFGLFYSQYIQKQIKNSVENKLLIVEKNILKPTSKGLFLLDGIASDLFIT